MREGGDTNGFKHLKAAMLTVECQLSTRATFPFKRDAVRQSQQSSDDLCNKPTLARRCASLPIDSNLHTTLKRTPTFPISFNPKDNDDCWWLKELKTIAKRASNEIDEIEVVDITDVDTRSSTDILKEVDIVKETKTDKPTTDSFGFPQEIPVEEQSLSNHLDDLQLQNYSANEINILQEKMKDLRIEIETSNDLDQEKRLKMEKVFQQVEDVVDGKIVQNTRINTVADAMIQSNHSAADQLRRTTVGITGGLTAAVGVVLIPCPIIPGCLIAYGGLLILATEFDEAKKALNIVRDPIDKWLSYDDTDNDGNPKSDDEEGKYNSFWEDMIGCKRRKKDIDDDFAKIMGLKNVHSSTSGSFNAPRKNESTPDTTKKMKQFLRKVLLLDAEEDDANENKDGTKESEPSDNDQQRESASNTSPCGCNGLSFDFDDDFNENGLLTIDPNKEKQKGNDINFQYRRFSSEGSITLNTLGNSDGNMNIQFSRQNTTSSSYGKDSDCLWVNFGCNSFS